MLTASLATLFERQSLGRKVSFNLLAFGLVGLGAILLLLNSIIDQRFGRLEQQEIEGHLDRAEAMLQGMQQTAEARSLDWAVWTDTYDYLHAPDREYEEANLTASSFQNLDAEAMGFVRFDGTFTKAVYFDLKSGEVDARAQAQFARLIAAPFLRKQMQTKKAQQGFVRFGNRVLVIAAAQILRSDGSGKAEGYFVTGRELRDADIVQALQLKAGLDPSAATAAVRIDRDANRIAIAKPIRSIGGEPIATIRFSVPRALSDEGRTLLWLTAGGVAALLVALIATLAWRIRATIVRPIETFQAHVSGISRTGELVAFDARREDELGALYREFNAMADELNSLRATVEAQSFAVGQSESTIGIMHNVRNAMSPVHAILSKLDERMHFPAEANLRRALDELATDAAEPERRSQLLAFVDAAVSRARDDLALHRSDLHEALRALGQVLETMSSAQEGHQLQADVLPADCDLSSIVGSSLRIVRHHPSLRISADYAAEKRFRIAAPRVLLAQVIDNLLTNATEAIAATEREHGEITICATRDSDAPDSRVRLTIRDDGDGFHPEEATGFFARGKSTRQKATPGGIGLHWCANTLAALGGAIAISSEGPGRGATVTLLLPIAPQVSEPADPGRQAA